jgi:hypothetical protein
MKQCTCYALRAIDCTCKPAKYGELYTTPTAKQERGEPVAVVDSTISGHIDWLCTFFPKQGTKLYTTPQPAQKPLTDEQMLVLLTKIDEHAVRLPKGLRDFARAIEAAHGIKENT